MKKQLLIITTVMSGYLSPSQSITETINLAEGKTNQSYYSLENGEHSNIDNQNWDLAFEASIRGSYIRINGQNGVELCVCPDGKITDWSDVGITDISDWPKLHNSTSTWFEGAFDQNNTGTEKGLEWEKYNSTTHAISVDSVYIIKLSDQNYRKLYIDKLYNGANFFTYANIDGSAEMDVTITKSEFEGKKNGYYSILNNETINREPNSEEWDFVYTKYQGNGGTAQNPYFMGFTGVLTNRGVIITEVGSSNIEDVIIKNQTFNDEIDIIGSDWKTYDRKTNSYTIVDTLSYFINDKNDNIWKLNFQGYKSTNGQIEFNKELLSTSVAGFTDNETITSFATYPNPESAEFQILYSGQYKKAIISISDPSERVVKTKSIENAGFSDNIVNLNGLSKGIYYLTLQITGKLKREKLVIN
jgi:hypothetical protein